jgi:hypothetical protein
MTRTIKIQDAEHLQAVGREKYGQTGVRTRDHPNLEGGATTAPRR